MDCLLILSDFFAASTVVSYIFCWSVSSNSKLLNQIITSL